MTLYLFKHSNYYNRILKRYDDIDGYIRNSIQLGVYQNINFKPYDGVQTFQILNHQGDTPDYIVCVDDSLAIDSRWYVVEDERLLNGQYRYTLLRDVIADYYSDILTAPCFVEKALLKADDDLIFNPEQMTFNQIKKEEYLLKDKSQSTWIVGYVDRSSPNENITVTGADQQAFNSAIEIDSSYMKYFRTYDSEGLPNGFATQKSVVSVLQNTYNYKVIVPLEFTYGSSDISKPYNNVRGYYKLYTNEDNDKVKWDMVPIVERLYENIPTSFFLGSICSEKSQEFIDNISKNINSYLQNNISAVDAINVQFTNKLKDTVAIDNANNQYVHNLNSTDIEYFIKNQDKILKHTYPIDSNGNTATKYYRIKVNIYDNVPKNVDIHYIFKPTVLANNYLRVAIRNNLSGQYTSYNNNTVTYISNSDQFPNEASTISNNSFNGIMGHVDGLSIGLADNNKTFVLDISEYSSEFTCTISNASNRSKNESGLYDIFAIPYTSNYKIQYKKYATSTNYEYFYNNDLVAMLAAQAIATKLGSTANSVSQIYDLQILPYCPCPEYISIDDDGQPFLDLGVLNSNSDVNYITDSSGTYYNSVLIWCSESRYQFTIDSPISLDKIDSPLDRKIDIETKMYRLCSPGYTSIYQFQPQFNNGINKFNVQFVYQPYNPFIRIAPVFNQDSLYGMNSQFDSKGLILKGDFQIPSNSSPWELYQINNKNYSEIYDREVQNLELTQSIERKMQIANAITGTISGTVSGATTGAVAGGGNPITAAAGAVVGGASSSIGGILDVKYGDMLREEALDYKSDMFGMQLDNIKALPNSLTKSSPLSDNNPIWPILEVYDCTDIERKAFKNKIKYNGMTVGIIGTINDYINNKQYYIDQFEYMYFKGKLIRLDGVYADSHIINAISNELNRGIYL